MNSKIFAFYSIAAALFFPPLRAAEESPWGNSPEKQSKPGVAQIGGYTDESDPNGDVPVDVVVDMTHAGKRIAKPTPRRPAYYLPLPVGYRDWGYEPFYQRSRPPASAVESLIEKELSKQGYIIMTHQHHPSLVLSFFWGYMSPEGNGTPAGYMDTLIWGDTMMYGYFPGNWISQATAFHDGRATDYLLLSKLGVPGGRFYVLVSAFDFRDWLHHKATLLWRAHISTTLWGHYFDQVLPALIATAAPMMGRGMTRPQVIEAPVVPMARVILGTPEIRDSPPASAAPAADATR